MKNKRGAARARQLLDEIGFDEITTIPMDIFVSSLNATLIEEPIKNSDGTIVRGRSKTLIKVNSEIPYPEKKRFTIAHEVGHLLLHEQLEVHNENSNTLNWFNNAEQQMKTGIQEWEANDFAAELLMPEQIFLAEAKGKVFGPELLKHLSERFQTSLTSTVFRCFELDIHPLLIISIHNGFVKYLRKSDNLWGRVQNIYKLPPPGDSVAQEYIDANYDFVYKRKDKKQEIVKSTWFELSDRDEDSRFYEYCIPTKSYKTIISVIWED
ncbi:MAG: ImmA/IrrE family metallo-endopeptidase [Bacteroidota bacterium]